MKKILVLGLVLALVAILAMPMAVFAADTTAGGTVPTPTIAVTAPSAIGFGTFVLGLNGPIKSTADGSVAVTNEVVGVTTWTVTTSASNDGYINDGIRSFGNRLQVSSGGAYQDANVALTYGSNPATLPFWASQTTVASDFDFPGAYSVTITFTGNLSF